MIERLFISLARVDWFEISYGRLAALCWTLHKSLSYSSWSAQVKVVGAEPLGSRSSQEPPLHETLQVSFLLQPPLDPLRRHNALQASVHQLTGMRLHARPGLQSERNETLEGAQGCALKFTFVTLLQHELELSAGHHVVAAARPSSSGLNIKLEVSVFFLPSVRCFQLLH